MENLNQILLDGVVTMDGSTRQNVTRRLRRFGRLTDGSVAIHEGFPGAWGAGRPGDEPGILAVADHPRRRPSRCPEAAATDAQGLPVEE